MSYWKTTRSFTIDFIDYSTPVDVKVWRSLLFSLSSIRSLHLKNMDWSATSLGTFLGTFELQNQINLTNNKYEVLCPNLEHLTFEAETSAANIGIPRSILQRIADVLQQRRQTGAALKTLTVKSAPFPLPDHNLGAVQALSEFVDILYL